MAIAQPHDQEPLTMSETEYLEFERESETKHEYAAGYVVAMTGASWNHNLINSNTLTALKNRLSKHPCRVVSSDMRLKVTSKRVSYRYPDIMVICGDPEFIDKRTDTVTNPTVIIEVLSPATALIDRNEKLDEYIKIASLENYILIAQHEAKVEIFTRYEAENWLYSQYKNLEAIIELASIECALSLADIYEQITFEQDGEV